MARPAAKPSPHGTPNLTQRAESGSAPSSNPDVLDLFLPPVAAWFRQRFGEPTPPQRAGWPKIAAGENTLILAPTGSGKTLAAFLAGLDTLWRHPRQQPGARILYISPLKALNADVARNLESPLAEVLLTATAMQQPLSPLHVAVRTGDTSQSERRTMVRTPPDILITTPESLHLLLTSQARKILCNVSHVIIDEIHAVCANKRGVFLAILLERLQHINNREFIRIGLSATQRPLSEVARYLGGFRLASPSPKKDAKLGASNSPWEERPVSIVDAGLRRHLDLEVILPAQQQTFGPSTSVWPGILEKLQSWVQSHNSTIIFANNRRVVETLTTRLNIAMNDAVAESITNSDELFSDKEEILFARSHHGSLSLPERRATESALKAGTLKAVVATASLELGIDMGAVDLVCQVESSGSIARGLQRVGRAGHVVGAVSKGKILAKTPGDLLEAAALAEQMVQGAVEPIAIPRRCLDILAQQVVACVAMDTWRVTDLYALFRRTYAYHDLTPGAFESVLEMISGRFGAQHMRDLKARVSWDRLQETLHPLPGTGRLAVTGGGTIPDTGQYPVYLGAEGPRLGELDEEFVLERRVGETFILGTSCWLIEAIEPQRVLVAPAGGQSACVPFWRGEGAGRTFELGRAVGALSRRMLEDPDPDNIVEWLRNTHFLNLSSAETLRNYFQRQTASQGAAPHDRMIVVESYRDQAGELGVVVLTPFGQKLHHSLKLVLTAALRERLGITLAGFHSDDGVLLRLPGMDAPPENLFEGLDAEKARALILEDLGDSALFGLRFRQNAGRALLMPKPDPSKRTPLWLQRIRAKDLLQITRQMPDFPIVVETYRQCLEEDLDLPHLLNLITQIQSGEIAVQHTTREHASPFAAELAFRFQAAYLYEWDDPAGDRSPSAGVNNASSHTSEHGLLADVTRDWLDDVALQRTEDRLRGVGRPPRTATEMAEWLRQVGDIEAEERIGPMAAFLETLTQENRVSLFTNTPRSRWILTEDLPLYTNAFGTPPNDEALHAILLRFFRTRALVGPKDIIDRYGVPPRRVHNWLQDQIAPGTLHRIAVNPENGNTTNDENYVYADPENLTSARRMTLALRRQESVAVTPEVFADFVARRQSVHPQTRGEQIHRLEQVLEQLQGHFAPITIWEQEILPHRIRDFRPAWLDQLLMEGHWIWQARDSSLACAFLPRDFPGFSPVDLPDVNAETAEDTSKLTTFAQTLLNALCQRGACFVEDLARELRTEPSRIREGMLDLVRRGLATNDRLAPLRVGPRQMITRADHRKPRPPDLGESRWGSRPQYSSPRNKLGSAAEGRWSALEPSGRRSFPATPTDADTNATLPARQSREDNATEWGLSWCRILMDRYGVLCRETAAMIPGAPPWRELAALLDRAEWRGEVRRGYLVEGLSGAQYAWPKTVGELSAHRIAGPPTPFLLMSDDPANLYGSGAPWDVPLLEGGKARLLRNAANHIVLSAGRPVLIIESHGRKLTGLASASAEELHTALKFLTGLTHPAKRVLKVETYNDQPILKSPVAARLQEIGFVRDHPVLTYYATDQL